MKTIYDILNQICEVKTSERDKGSRFEEIVRLYLKHEPEWKQQFKNVVLWSKWEGRNNRPDTGIDLVATTHDDQYVAVQCKCYEKEHRIQKGDIDSFLSASSKKEFVRRIIVATADLSSNAADAIKDQNPPVHVIGLADLENSKIDWSQFDPDKPGKVKLQPKKELREHQKEAVKAVIDAFKEVDRGKLIMACGTGKTFTSLKIAEKYAGKAGTVLFLVPSLSLMSQTLKEWTEESSLPLHCYGVCSDVKVGKHDDIDPTAPDDLAIPATTDSKSLAKSFTVADDRMTVVFSTYQSIDAISEAQKKGVPEFDLIICDEAHRTTGAQLESEDESEFVRVHDSKFIKAKKRLYMTATPRLYSADTKAKAKDNNITVWSMDDESVYGKELHSLGFSKAVNDGLLSDYKVVILGVDERVVSSTFQLTQQPGKKELPLVDPAKIVGCWNALAGKFGDSTKKQSALHRAVAFTTSIKQSQTFRDQFSGIIDEYHKGNPDDKKTLHCNVRHVDGTMDALKRNELLTWLKSDTSLSANECRILTNARCLSEGVDVPALDAVMFLTPRKSKVDVVQSVGRVMRKAPGKDYGYVILPIVIKAGVDPNEALNDNETYKVVWDVLQALRAHDDRFQNAVNIMELEEKRPESIIVDFIGTSRGVPGTAREVLPTSAQTKFSFTFDDIQNWKLGIYARIVQKCGEKRYWEEWAKDVAKIAQKHIETLQHLLANEEHAVAFTSFMSHLKSNLNDDITENDAIEMLAQHIITKPVFDALFNSTLFSEHNPVSQALDKVVGLLEDVEGNDTSLNAFYESVRNRVKGVETAAGKQKIILELYDKFFKTAFPKMSEKLGIVYTPVEVVDFILHSVDYILRKDFGGGFNAKGNDILDPFTGTGTFITRLLQSGLIDPENLRWEYENEIHANEIVLLAYYIAAVNIENTFHEECAKRCIDTSLGASYTPFPGIVLTDTFTMTEGNQKQFTETFPVNSKRARKQKEKTIRIIIGNPPYSAGQKSENDANKNQKYPQLDDKIRTTYADASTATNKNSLYDSYIRSIRWASDRIGEQGIIGFVSNGSYIDGNAMDGLRKCFAEEFTDIYVFNCRGNARTSGEQRRKEKGNVFGEGTRTPIAITIFVKNPAEK